ncbi:MAG: 3-isopropylmalate dehydrogenase [Vicinamibacteria bacterium]
MQEKRIAVIPGDGIGIDVTREAMAVIGTLREVTGAAIATEEFDFGAERYLKTGVSLPEGAYEMFQRDFDALFIGALGDPRVPDMAHARDILLGTRFVLDLYANHRPVKLLHDDLCPLKGRGRDDVNFVVFRENTEGLYVGMGGIFKKGTPDEIATQEDINTRKGVERIIEHAFRFAKENDLTKVTMSDKSNALRFGHDIWQRVFAEVAARYPGVEANHLYIDVLALQMVKNPAQFQVVVTCNMFGDIVTDLGAALQGGLGMAASGNINPDGVSMFEPVHGSAPKYAGKNVANPFGAILSTQMMLEHLGFRDEAALVERAVVASIEHKETPKELGGDLGTREVGESVSRRIRELASV